MITTATIYTDMVTLLGSVLGGLVVQSTALNGLTGPAYEVKYQNPFRIKLNKSKPVLYYHRLNTGGPVEYITTCNAERLVSVRVGMRAHCDESPEKYGPQLDALLCAFGQDWGLQDYNFTFKGQQITRLYDTGIMRVESGEVLQIPDPSCDCIQHEFRVDFFILFEHLQKKIA